MGVLGFSIFLSIMVRIMLAVFPLPLQLLWRCFRAVFFLFIYSYSLIFSPFAVCRYCWCSHWNRPSRDRCVSLRSIPYLRNGWSLPRLVSQGYLVRWVIIVD